MARAGRMGCGFEDAIFWKKDRLCIVALSLDCSEFQRCGGMGVGWYEKWKWMGGCLETGHGSVK